MRKATPQGGLFVTIIIDYSLSTCQKTAFVPHTWAHPNVFRIFGMISSCQQIYGRNSPSNVEIKEQWIDFGKEGNFMKLRDKYEHSSSPEFITLYPGTIVYLLQYTGEGTYLALWNGQLLWWLEGYNISGFTNANPSSPWGVYVGEATDASLGIDFWMCLRKADGTVGWAHPKDYPSGTFNQYWK